MSTLRQLRSVQGKIPELEGGDTRSGASENRRPRPHGIPNVSQKPANLDGCIDSLKVLGLALLGEIDSLAEQAAMNEAKDLNLQTEVRRFEALLIRSALIRTGGRQRRAARLLGTKVTTLNTKIKRYKITLENTAFLEDLSD
jgi:transcriptional regulator with GAF, ATPase, and Fis domain